MRKSLLAILLLALPLGASASRLRQRCDSLEVLAAHHALERDSVMRVADSLQIELDSSKARALHEASVHRRLNFALKDAETNAQQVQDFNDQLLLLCGSLCVVLLFVLAAVLMRRFLRRRTDRDTTEADLRIDRMHKLVRLRESGILSVDEAESLKKELLEGGGE